MLAVAGIAALAGILGATVGGYFTYRGANLQSQAAAHAAQMQSHANAVLAERTERKDAYAKYLVGYSDLIDQLLQLHNIFVDEPGNVEKRNTTLEEYDQKYGEWYRLSSTMSLIDSAEVEDANVTMYKIQTALNDKVYEIMNALPNIPPDRMNEFDKQYEDARNSVPVWFAAAQKDLQNLGYGDH